jgi:hypothetical protein
VGRDDAARGDEPGGGPRGRAPPCYRRKEPQLLAPRSGHGRMEGIHRQAQEGGRSWPSLNLNNYFLFLNSFSPFSRPVIQYML